MRTQKEALLLDPDMRTGKQPSHTLSRALHLCRRRSTFDWKSIARVAFSHSDGNVIGATVGGVLRDFSNHLVGLPCLARGTLEPAPGLPLGGYMDIQSCGDPSHPSNVFVVAEGCRGMAEPTSSRADGCEVSKRTSTRVSHKPVPDDPTRTRKPPCVLAPQFQREIHGPPEIVPSRKKNNTDFRFYLAVACCLLKVNVVATQSNAHKMCCLEQSIWGGGECAEPSKVTPVAPL